MNVVDLLLVAVLFLFGLRGYFKGLFREICSIAGLVIGFMMAVRYDEPVATLAANHWNTSPILLKGIAFVAIFFLVYLFFSLIGWLLRYTEKILFLRTFNRIGGIAVGIGKGAALTALAIFFIASGSWVPSPARERIQDSYLVPSLSVLAERLVRLGKQNLFSHENARVSPSSQVAL